MTPVIRWSASPTNAIGQNLLANQNSWCFQFVEIIKSAWQISNYWKVSRTREMASISLYLTTLREGIPWADLGSHFLLLILALGKAY
jgi:hypothetical protein